MRPAESDLSFKHSVSDILTGMIFKLDSPERTVTFSQLEQLQSLIYFNKHPAVLDPSSQNNISSSSVTFELHCVGWSMCSVDIRRLFSH